MPRLRLFLILLRGLCSLGAALGVFAKYILPFRPANRSLPFPA